MLKRITSRHFKKVFIIAEEILNDKKDLINNLNVFPVPDGDTGTNMSMALNEIVQSIDDKKEYQLKELADVVSEAALMGARGNSGVILSQFIGGFCEVISEKEEIDKKVLLDAFTEGKNGAYESVSDPKEGTILTIMGSAVEQLESMQKRDDLVDMMKATVHHCQEVLKKTPEMLKTLKEAGVVDAGGAGFVYFLEAFYRAVANTNAQIRDTEDFSAPAIARTWSDSFGVFGMGGIRSVLEFNYNALKKIIKNTGYILKKGFKVILAGKDLVSFRKGIDLMKKLSSQMKLNNIKKSNTAILQFLRIWKKTPEERYCYEVILKGVKEKPSQIKEELKDIGSSLIVADHANKKLTKIHFHINDKKAVDKKMKSYGEIVKRKVEDMHAQQKEFVVKKEKESKEFSDDTECALLAVANGAGFKEIYKGFQNVYILDGGETMNPSVADFQKRIKKIDQKDIILLPNNKNVFMAARKVCEKMDEKNVKYVKTKNQAEGLSVLVAFEKDRSLKENMKSLDKALENIDSFLVSNAAKNTQIDGKKVVKEDVIALCEKSLIAKGTKVEEVTLEAIKKYDKKDLITLYWGNGLTKEIVDKTKEKIKENSSCELQVYNGNQPHYYFIVTLE